MGYLNIADELDKDGELRIIANDEYNIYINEQQARDLIVQIETVFANSGKALFDDSTELAKVKAARDALKAKLDGGVRVHYDGKEISTWLNSYKPFNATLIPDEGVKL